MNIINTSSNNGNNINEIRILYNPPKKYQFIKIFDEKFVKKNSEKCKIKINYSVFKLSAHFQMVDSNEIKLLIDMRGITDMSYMFYNCKYLKSYLILIK